MNKSIVRSWGRSVGGDLVGGGWVLKGEGQTGRSALIYIPEA